MLADIILLLGNLTQYLASVDIEAGLSHRKLLTTVKNDKKG